MRSARRRVRDAVPFSAYLLYKHAGGGGESADARDDEHGHALTPEGLVAQARRMIAKYGFQVIKFKAGVFDPEIEMENVRLLRSAFGPTVPIRMDPNSAWSVETSVCV
jgi:glucarate dehydratase